MRREFDKYFWGGLIVALVVVFGFYGLKERKAETRKAVEMRGPSAGDVEDTRVFVLRTMVKDLNGPDAPKGGTTNKGAMRDQTGDPNVSVTRGN